MAQAISFGEMVAAFGEQHTEESRAIFNKAIDQATDPEQIARLEVAREYFTNQTFKKALADATFAATYR